MKQLLTFLLCIAFGLKAFSQSQSTNQIDLSGGISISNVYRFLPLEGDAYISSGKAYGFELEYNKLIVNKIWINTGLGYTKIPNVFHTMPIDVNRKFNLDIVQIPVRIKYDLFSWLYFKSGLTFDYQLNDKVDLVDNQSGIGFSFVGGVNLNISESVLFNIECSLASTSLIPFHLDDSHQHYFISGINLGFGYRF